MAPRRVRGAPDTEELRALPYLEERFGRDVLVIDGAMGTMLQRAEVPPEQSPMQLNITAPELIEQIHRYYAIAGADCATTNSFGGTRHKLAAYGHEDQLVELNRAAVRLARAGGSPYVLADMGPTGLVLEPLGTARFETVFSAFAEQAAALALEHPDAFLIETMIDIAEARAAVLAVRSVSNLPVIVTCTFGLSGRMDLSGTTPETAAVILEAAGASAVGMNCGLGPEQMLPLVEKMVSATSLPVIVQPNAGLPRLEDGVTVFPGTPDEMGEYAERFANAGAAFVGSCCGSTPGFTAAIAEYVRGRQVLGAGLEVAQGTAQRQGVVVAGPRGIARIGGTENVGRVAVIGERVNPTGKKRLAESLRAGQLDVVREYAVEQAAAGADLLDVNVGAASVDQKTMLPRAVLALAGLVDLPLVIDTTDAAALEEALKRYPGRALVNSVSGETASLDAVLPLVKRYGAAVVVLALDDDGIPATAAERIAVVERIRARAHEAGLSDSDLLVDCLTLAAATDEAGASETLEAVRSVSEGLGLATLLGISNVSHGLPGRPDLNAAFVRLARQAGLTAVIANPSDDTVMGAVRAKSPAGAGDAYAAAEEVLLGRDARADRWIARIAAASENVPGTAAQSAGTSAVSSAASQPSAAERLGASVERGAADAAPALVDELVATGTDPRSIIADVLTPAIQRLGDAYGRGDVFLPQLIAAADAMKAAVGRAKHHLPAGATMDAGRIAFGTVKGDIHSIGKDICVSMLESQGFEVEDLGVDVPADRFVAAAATADAVCMSALMTTTLANMEAAIAGVRAAGDVPILIGGAVVTADFAAGLGVGYSADAPGCVLAVQAAVEQRRGAAS